MNTSEKGTAFELKVHRLIETLLQKGDFSVLGNHFEIFHHKDYYSEKRKGNICIDLSVEFRRKLEAMPSLYVMIECKDYKTPVPVGDVEEFYAKTQQITGLNVKAMMFSRSSFQEGGFNFALSNGIALIRILDDDSLAWLVERTNKHLIASQPNSVSLNVINALTNEYFVSTRKDTFGILNKIVSYTIDDILKEVLKDFNLIEEINP